MACGEQVEVEETDWDWCWTWHGPWLCKNSTIVTRFRYDFLPSRSRVTWPFRCKYEGCCGGKLYRWSYWCLRGTGNSGWDRFNTRTRYFESLQSPVRDCPVSEGQIERSNTSRDILPNTVSIALVAIIAIGSGIFLFRRASKSKDQQE